MGRSLSGKHGQKHLHQAKQSARDNLERVIQKNASLTGDLICNKIGVRITKVSRSSPKKKLETITNEHEKEILKKRYKSLEERQKIIADLRVI